MYEIIKENEGSLPSIMLGITVTVNLLAIVGFVYSINVGIKVDMLKITANRDHDDGYQFDSRDVTHVILTCLLSI